MRAKIYINKEIVCDALEQCLGSEYVLYTKTRKAHWNVVGQNFEGLHELFQNQYEILDEIIDAMAERIRQLGFVSPGTLQEFIQLSVVQERPGWNPATEEMIADLLQDYAVMADLLDRSVDVAEQAGDIGTANFLTDKLEEHDKMAWMLRAHLSQY